jgi:hypothetical protein
MEACGLRSINGEASKEDNTRHIIVGCDEAGTREIVVDKSL